MMKFQTMLVAVLSKTVFAAYWPSVNSIRDLKFHDNGDGTDSIADLHVYYEQTDMTIMLNCAVDNEKDSLIFWVADKTEGMSTACDNYSDNRFHQDVRISRAIDAENFMSHLRKQILTALRKGGMIEGKSKWKYGTAEIYRSVGKAKSKLELYQKSQAEYQTKPEYQKLKQEYHNSKQEYRKYMDNLDDRLANIFSEDASCDPEKDYFMLSDVISHHEGVWIITRNVVKQICCSKNSTDGAKERLRAIARRRAFASRLINEDHRRFGRYFVKTWLYRQYDLEDNKSSREIIEEWKLLQSLELFTKRPKIFQKDQKEFVTMLLGRVQRLEKLEQKRIAIEKCITDELNIKGVMDGIAIATRF